MNERTIDLDEKEEEKRFYRVEEEEKMKQLFPPCVTSICSANQIVHLIESDMETVN